MVKVSQVMGPIVVIEDSVSVKDAAKIMSTKNITNLVVIKDKKIMGIITDRDVLKNLSRLGESVRKIMSRHVTTISSDAELEEAGRIMTDKKIKRLPVVKNGKLVGAVNFTDVIGHCEFSKGDGDSGGDFFFN